MRLPVPENVSRGSRIQYGCCRLICGFIIGAVFILDVGVALADDASRTTFERLQPASKSETALGRIPVSTLNVTLTGVVKGKTNIAVISVGGARDELFAVGQTIAPNVTLLAVDSSGAVISHDGAAKRLAFSRRVNASSAATSDSQVAVPVTVAAETQLFNAEPRLFNSGRMVAFIPAGAVQDLGNSRFSVDRGFANEQLRSGDLLANARIAPDTSGAYRVSEIVPGSVYDTVGLRDGDAISAVNGRSLKSIADIMSLYVQRDSMKTMEIRVTREGVPRNLQLDFH